LADDFADTRLAFCDTLPPSDDLIDAHRLEQGKRLELDWLSGSVIELARRLAFQRR